MTAAGRVAAAFGEAEDGFTLLEVLVSFMIVSLVLASLLNAYSGGLNRISKADRAVNEAMLLSALIDRVGLDLPALPGLQSGETGDGRTWQIRISAIDTGDSVNRFQVSPHRVDATIFDVSGNPGRNLSTIVLARPEPAE